MGYPLNLCSNLELIPTILQSRVVLYRISLLMAPSPSPCDGSHVYLHCTLAPLQSLRANRDLSVQPVIGAGWVRGVKTDGCQQGSYQRTCQQKKKALYPPRGPVEFRLKVQQENKLSSCTPELCCQFEKH